MQHLIAGNEVKPPWARPDFNYSVFLAVWRIGKARTTLNHPLSLLAKMAMVMKRR
jgi:hypothetical protein